MGFLRREIRRQCHRLPQTAPTADSPRGGLIEGGPSPLLGLARSWVVGYNGGMSTEPPIPRELWDQMPAAAQAAVLALVQSLDRRIAALGARLVQGSSNTSKPRSSNPVHVKRRPPGPLSAKGCGGQQGHKRHTRELVPPERLTAAVEFTPTACWG